MYNGLAARILTRLELLITLTRAAVVLLIIVALGVGALLVLWVLA